jgi:hypothetical protein
VHAYGQHNFDPVLVHVAPGRGLGAWPLGAASLAAVRAKSELAIQKGDVWVGQLTALPDKPAPIHQPSLQTTDCNATRSHIIVERSGGADLGRHASLGDFRCIFAGLWRPSNVGRGRSVATSIPRSPPMEYGRQIKIQEEEKIAKPKRQSQVPGYHTCCVRTKLRHRRHLLRQATHPVL